MWASFILIIPKHRCWNFAFHPLISGETFSEAAFSSLFRSRYIRLLLLFAHDWILPACSILCTLLFSWCPPSLLPRQFPSSLPPKKTSKRLACREANFHNPWHSMSFGKMLLEMSFGKCFIFSSSSPEVGAFQQLSFLLWMINERKLFLPLKSSPKKRKRKTIFTFSSRILFSCILETAKFLLFITMAMMNLLLALDS